MPTFAHSHPRSAFGFQHSQDTNVREDINMANDVPVAEMNDVVDTAEVNDVVDMAEANDVVDTAEANDIDIRLTSDIDIDEHSPDEDDRAALEFLKAGSKRLFLYIYIFFITTY